jgi:NADH:ubiquinone oxidoreductase subunit H
MRSRHWLPLLFLLLVIADYAIPYSPLLRVNKLSGAFLFWISISLLAIALVIAASWGWGE